MEGAMRPEERAVQLFTQEKWSCSESVLLAMAEHWGMESECIPRIATPFRGGLCGTQHLCGAVSGSLMAIGLQLGRNAAGDDATACVETGKAFLHFIEEECGALDCRTLTGLDFSDEEQHNRFLATTRGDVCVGLITRCCRWLAEHLPPQP